MTKEIAQAEETNIIQQEQPVASNPLQAAIQAGASPSELLQFMELQERWEANEARKAYVAAMAKFRADCPTIEKTEEGHNSNYAGLAGTIRQIKTLMSDNGLSHSWETNQEGNNITVKCCVTHVMGHSECTSLTAQPDTTGSKNSIQAIGSTVTYLERYTLFARLGLSSGDADDDGEMAEPAETITDAQAEELRLLLVENDRDVARFEAWLMRDLKCMGIKNIHANKFDFVMDQAKAAINKAKKK